MIRAADALRDATRRLTEAGIEGAPRDARRLLAHALGLAPDRLTLHLQDEVGDAAKAAFEAAMTARLARQPVAQITGERLFWGRSFRVTRDTLDPRPETETLVAEALSHALHARPRLGDRHRLHPPEPFGRPGGGNGARRRSVARRARGGEG